MTYSGSKTRAGASLKRPSRILMIRSGGLGDFVLSLPVMAALREKWPTAELQLLGTPGIAELARNRFYCRAVLALDDARFARLFSEAQLPPDLAEFLSTFDLAVTFLGDRESTVGRNLTAFIPQVIFVSRPHSGSMHASLHFLSAPGLPGIAASTATPKVLLQQEDLRIGRKMLSELLPAGFNRYPVLIHPGSGSSEKNWTPEGFAGAAKGFYESGFPVILVQGEADEEPVIRVLELVRIPSIGLLKGRTVIDLARALSQASLLVGNDSGVSHLAAAVGAPLVCLFGPSDPAVWKPLGIRVKVLTFAEATPERVCAEGLKLMSP